MPTLSSNSLRIDARSITRHLSSHNPPNIGSTFRPEHAVKVSLSVDDARIRQQVDRFDGMERPFAMIPSERNGVVTWWRHELRYSGEGAEGFMELRKVDRYELGEVRNVDLAAVKKHGIAVGLETNVGTLWAQEPGKNAKVRHQEWF